MIHIRSKGWRLPAKAIDSAWVVRDSRFTALMTESCERASVSMHGPVSSQRWKKKPLMSESIHQIGALRKNLAFGLARSSRWLSCRRRRLHSVIMAMPSLIALPTVLMTSSQRLH
jgi:hypothetical protein